MKTSPTASTAVHAVVVGHDTLESAANVSMLVRAVQPLTAPAVVGATTTTANPASTATAITTAPRMGRLRPARTSSFAASS